MGFFEDGKSKRVWQSGSNFGWGQVVRQHFELSVDGASRMVKSVREGAGV